MAKGKYYTPEFKEQAVKMAVGLDLSEARIPAVMHGNALFALARWRRA